MRFNSCDITFFDNSDRALLYIYPFLILISAIEVCVGGYYEIFDDSLPASNVALYQC